MKVKVSIENLDRTIDCEVGGDLRSALLENDVMLYAPSHTHTNCHGKGLCTTCQIEIVKGAETTSDQSFIEKLRVSKGRRLACQTRVYQDLVIRTLHEPQGVEY